ncbi:hypothetical protein BGZ94_008493 [Podila epigama]|nr:hypothetical protein BGZ94_008493 [Podila epigama]
MSESGGLARVGKNEFPPPPLPASALQGLQNLGCGCCGQRLLRSDEGGEAKEAEEGQGRRGPAIQRVVDLPSEHWQELVDCWMCHEEDFTELREGDLGARRGQALVGGTYVLIHAEDVDASAVMIEQDARAVDREDGTALDAELGLYHCNQPRANTGYNVAMGRVFDSGPVGSIRGESK